MTDEPFTETKDLIAGWFAIDVHGYDRALELAGELPAAPGAGGKPLHEWRERRASWPSLRPSRQRRVSVEDTQIQALTPQVIAELVNRGAGFAVAEGAVAEGAVQEAL